MYLSCVSEALVQALNGYSGAVVVVSHDRHMLELIADRLVLVDDGTAREFDGSIEDYTNFVLAKAGLKPTDVSFIGVGASSGAVAAMRSGQIDAISNLDPVITLLQRSGDLKIVSDTRVVAEADKVFGGPMPAACLYAKNEFVEKNPATAQALASAIVRADKWIQAAGPGDIIKAVPESYLLGDRAVYIDAFLAAKGALSPDGMFPEKGPDTAFRALASIDAEIAKAKLDLPAVFTNEFAKKANAKYPKA